MFSQEVFVFPFDKSCLKKIIRMLLLSPAAILTYIRRTTSFSVSCSMLGQPHIAEGGTSEEEEVFFQKNSHNERVLRLTLTNTIPFCRHPYEESKWPSFRNQTNAHLFRCAHSLQLVEQTCMWRRRDKASTYKTYISLTQQDAGGLGAHAQELLLEVRHILVPV